MKFDIGKHPDRAGVWCVFGWGDRDGDERIISTHSTRDGAVVSCNQLRRAECPRCEGEGTVIETRPLANSNYRPCPDCTPENVEELT